MALSLLLFCAASTASARAGGFSSADEPLDERGARDAAAWRLPPRFGQVLPCSPWASARQTAAAIGDARPDPALADMDGGAWSGMGFDRIETDFPGALARWLDDPAGGAPGGESLTQAKARIGGWLDDMVASDKAACAVTHPMMVRAALMHAIGLSAQAALAIDLAPLSGALLSFNRRWRLQALGSVGF